MVGKEQMLLQHRKESVLQHIKRGFVDRLERLQGKQLIWSNSATLVRKDDCASLELPIVLERERRDGSLELHGVAVRFRTVALLLLLRPTA